MTSPDDSTRGPGSRFLRGRRPSPLLSIWGGLAIVAAIVYAFEYLMPAFHELVMSVYWIMFGIAIVLTLRWFRGRSARRREADRRLAERRDETSDEGE